MGPAPWIARSLLAAALLFAGPPAIAAEPPEGDEAERLLFLLQYIASDYRVAVADGAIRDPFEFDEIVEFSRLLVERAALLEARGAPPAVAPGLAELHERIVRRAATADVEELAGRLAHELLAALDESPLPTERPDLAAGRALYAAGCAACHGPAGRGDGPAAGEMGPPPTSFAEARMRTLSPLQVWGATTYGIPGTAMPSYAAAWTPRERWNVAFWVMTLRDGFDPEPPPRALALTLGELASRSDDELRREHLLLSAGELPQGWLDHERLHPPAPAARGFVVNGLPAGDGELAAAAAGAGSRASSSLEVALGLQEAFAGVAERAFPSVVGVTGFVRRPAGEPSGRAAGGAWVEPSEEERLYPGFARARSASGFVVDSEGTIVTAAWTLERDDRSTVDLVDVERPDGVHELARIVGLEPTLGLGVLRLERFGTGAAPALPPLPLADRDAARTGHWVIALGRPWGPGRAFAVGTLASPPERECYQEDRTATLFQASLRVAPGSWGGPLVDIHGRVLGVVLPGRRPAEAELTAFAPAQELALPVDLALTVVQALVTTESRRTPWLGLSVRELAAVRRERQRAGGDTQALPRTGVWIDDVYEPSPAAAAGIRPGDALVALDGQRLYSVGGFQRWLYISGIGRRVQIEVWRDGETLERAVTIEERPAAAAPR